MAELVRNVRNAQAPPRPGARLEEDTVVAVLNTIHEIVSDSLDNTRSLLQARGVPALVALVASRCGGEGSVVWGAGDVGEGPPLTPPPAPQPICTRGEGGVARVADSVELQRAAWYSAERWLDQGALPGAASLAFPAHFALFPLHVLHPPCVCVLCLSRLLLLPRGLREHRVLGASMTARCHWWTRALVSGGG